jgi:hypothetical protein
LAQNNAFATEAGTLGVSTPVSVPAMVGGTALAANGADNMWAGLQSLWSGQLTETYTQQIITAVTGSPTAGLWGNVAIGTAGGNWEEAGGESTDRYSPGLAAWARRENAVGNTAPKIGITMPSGVTRFPDEFDMDLKILTEVKNVQSLSYTQQLRDYAAFTRQNGGTFNLYVRPSTSYSGPLQQTIDNEEIILHYIPGTK